MHVREDRSTVALLRPPESSLVSLLQSKSGSEVDSQEKIYGELLDERIGYLRSHIGDVAEEIGFTVSRYEHQLCKETEVPGRKATRWIQSSNVITAFDPQERLLAYLCACVRANPVLAVVLVHSGNLEEHFHILGTQKTVVALFEQGRMQWRHVARMLGLPLDDDERARSVFRQALTPNHWPLVG